MAFDPGYLPIINNSLVFLTAATVTYNLYQNRIMVATLNETKDIVQKTEINTNSMKDALVASTAKASRLQGRDEVRVENIVENKRVEKLTRA